MKVLILVAVLASLPLMAEEVAKLEAMHGKEMAVKWVVTDEGQNRLLAEKLMGRENGKAKFKTVQTVEFQMQSGEKLSDPDFKCRELAGSIYAYAVISSKTAKKSGKFHPVKGWAVNREGVSLDKVHNVAEIDCEWKPEGEDQWPF